MQVSPDKSFITTPTTHAHARPGYVLIFTLTTLSLAVLLATYIFNRGTIFTLFSRTITQREQAKALATSGLQIARSKLSFYEKKEEGQERETSGDKTKSKAPEIEKKILTQLLPYLNSWQEFQLTEAEDGIDAQIKICLCCENGKLNINELYDFDKKAFKIIGKDKDALRKLLALVFEGLKPFADRKDLLPALESYLKKRGKPLDDVTQLLEKDEFKVFNDRIFYQPAPVKKPDAKVGEQEQKRQVYLTDIFTVATSDFRMNPWLFSEGIHAMLGLASLSGTAKQKKEEVVKLTKNFAPTAAWKTDWDKILKPFYKKEFKSLPSYTAGGEEHDFSVFLAPKFECSVMSVISCATVGSLSCTVVGILEKTEGPTEEGTFNFEVTKIYTV